MNGPIKSPKFEKKFERERTSNFCILWADCEQIVSDKVEANLNEVGKLLTMWRHFSYHLVFRPRLWLTFEGQKQKFAVRSRSNFFSNFGHFTVSIIENICPLGWPRISKLIFINGTFYFCVLLDMKWWFPKNFQNRTTFRCPYLPSKICYIRYVYGHNGWHKMPILTNLETW